MTTRLKTVEYWFPHLATIPDNSTTNFTQITVYLPEDSKSFKSVYVECNLADAYTTATNVTARNLGVRLGANSYSTTSFTQTLTQSGENFTLQILQDFTSYFDTYWSGTSMTMDLQVTVNTSSLGCRNGSAKVVITYEYDDESTTHVKTAWIPIYSTHTALYGSKQASANDTIPALDTYCPEASKTFRQTTIVIQGNTESNSSTDISLSFQIDSAGDTLTSQLFEKGSNVDYWYRLNEVVSFTTSDEHDFYLWCSSAGTFYHPQTWLVVTYEFDPATTTTVLNSLILPVEFAGGSTGTQFQRASREFWIQEPETITAQRNAVYYFYSQKAAISGVNVRFSSDTSFVNYLNVANVVGGGCGLMIKNYGLTFTRGRNSLNCDIYDTDTSDILGNLSAFFIINYTSGVATDGIGSHNKTIFWNLYPQDNNSATAERVTSDITISIPETNYFITSIGVEGCIQTNSTITPQGFHVGVRDDDNTEWLNVYESMGSGDPECSPTYFYSTARSVFNRWKTGAITDADSSRIDIETTRKWRIQSGGGTAFYSLNFIVTYHTITYTVGGTISGSGGGTVNLTLARVSPCEPVLQTSRTGNGTYSFTWFDDTENMMVSAYEDDTHTGMTGRGTAT